MARWVLMAEVSGGRARGRPGLGWMDGVKVFLSNRGMTVEATRQCAKDRKEWRALVHMSLIEFNAAISFGPPSRALVVITWRGVDAVTLLLLLLKKWQCKAGRGGLTPYQS